MKKILISIRPQWVAKILSGEKTIEVRRTAPKCELPCEVYIYCTKQKILGNLIKVGSEESSELFGKNAIVGINKGFMQVGDIDLQGKVVAKFTLNKVEKIEYHRHRTLNDFDGYYIDHGEKMNTSEIEIGEMACLNHTELNDYLKEQNGYAWHIDNLVIFDKPKDLSDYGVKRSPQSWQFIEVANEFR